jgi:LacI family transcriptional regulator
VVGLIVLDAANPIEMGVARGIEEAVEAAGHAVLLGSSAGRMQRERRYVELFEQQVGDLLKCGWRRVADDEVT